MTKQSVALIAVILAIGGVIGYKQLRPPVVHAGNEQKIVLVADLRKADDT